MPNAVILGGGMVGSVMAMDLAADFDVTVADNRAQTLKRIEQRVSGVKTIRADLSQRDELKRAIDGADIVLGALASAIAFDALRTVIEAGCDYCDIAFMPEDALKLNDLAKQHGVTAVVDCGVAPGMSNMFVGYAAAKLDEVQHVTILVGGIPRHPKPPFNYKAGFSPHDVIEEYTRPARIVRGGEIVVCEALSEVERVEFDGVGTLEAFITDGLRSLVQTIRCPEMIEKTLRYPGHAEQMRLLRDIGFFGGDAVEAGRDGAKVRPIDVTASLLFPHWTYDEGEEDLTVMRVIVEGKRDGRGERHTLELLDAYDRDSRCTSMSRTTGLTATVMARLMVAGAFARPGVHPPENVGRETTLFERIVEELTRRGVRYDLNEADHA